MSYSPENVNEADGGEYSGNTEYEGICFSVWLLWYPYFAIIFVDITIMHILFHQWNITSEEDEDITLLDDSEAMQPPPKISKK